MFAPKVQGKAPTGRISLLAPRAVLAAHRPGDSLVEQVESARQTIGNQAALRFLTHGARSRATTERDDQDEHEDHHAIRQASGSVWDFSKIPLYPADPSGGREAVSRQTASSLRGILQRKVVVGDVNDPLEHEADRIAEAVLASSPSLASDGSPQRPPITIRAAGETVPRDAAPGNHAGARVGGSETVVADGGAPLSADLRSYFEPRFGHDFSQVRVHTGAKAIAAAARVGARAFTVGSNIAFSANRYAPITQAGRRLIAHELAHVVQGETGRTTKLHRQPTGSGEAQTASTEIPDIHDTRISDNSTQAELRKIYRDHGYEGCEGKELTFHRVRKNHWEANEPLCRRQVNVYEEGSAGSTLQSGGEGGNVSGPPGSSEAKSRSEGGNGDGPDRQQADAPGSRPQGGKAKEGSKSHGQPEGKGSGTTSGKQGKESGESQGSGGKDTDLLDTAERWLL